jgi:hypothetical protein
MIYLSLFDGMSCLQLAIQKANMKKTRYSASEIDKYAIQVTQKNYPNTIQLGDVRDIDVSQLEPIDFIGGGSPCKSFSFAGKRKGMATKCDVEIYTLEKYLELKKKQLIQMNQNGGSICDIVNRFVKIVHAVSDKTLDCSGPNISLKGNILHDRNQLFTIINIRDDIYIIKNNNNCITSIDRTYRLEPINMRDNQLFRLVKLPDNYYVIHHINNGLCVDANWDQDIIAKEYIEDDNNQKFYITPYFKNNDNHLNKIIIDINTGIFYKSVKEASYYNNFTRTNLSEYLNGKRKGKINLKYA